MSDEPKSKKQFDFLNGSLSLTSVLSLLGAGAIGVWSCANTLNDIKNSVGDTKRDLVEAKGEINAKLDSHAAAIQTIQLRTDDLWMQNHDTKLTLIDIQAKMDKNNRAAVDRDR
jgi:peptidoglycan hydrolase CwlO-like protein